MKPTALILALLLAGCASTKGPRRPDPKAPASISAAQTGSGKVTASAAAAAQSGHQTTSHHDSARKRAASLAAKADQLLQ